MNNIINTLNNLISEKKEVALVTIIDKSGSVPQEIGSMMIVDKDGLIDGTIGGGKLEFQVIEYTKELIEKKESQEKSFILNEDEELGMVCGGYVKVFIKTFVGMPKLIIVGSGHVGLNLCKLGNVLQYETIVIDDKEDWLNKSEAKKKMNIEFNEIHKYKDVLSNGYVVIATRSHNSDYEVLKQFINFENEYLGMIGSKKKTINLIEKLKTENIEFEDKNIYAPIGIGISDNTAKEVAFSIMSEILLIKNDGKLKHKSIFNSKVGDVNA